MCDVLYSICVPFQSPGKDCAVSETQKPSVSKTLLDICHTAWDPRYTRDPSNGCSFWPQQPDTKSRLGPGLVPPSRRVRADDEMSVQEKEATHVPLTHLSASESTPLDVLVASVEPEDSAQTMSTRRITLKRPLNPLDRAEPPKRTRGMRILHFSLLIIMIWRMCLKI